MAKRKPNRKTARPQRDAAGHFVAGCKGGPGNPQGRVHAEFQRMVSSAVTPDDMAVIIAKLVEQARDGCLPAIALLLDRVCGRTPTYSELELEERMAAIEATLAGRAA